MSEWRYVFTHSSSVFISLSLGTCQTILNNSSMCHCPSAWEGRYCEWKKKYCQNVTCLHDGVCQSLWNGYQCQCLSGSYTGDHCETISSETVFYQYMSKSFAFVAITMIGSVGLFIVVMDVLKYCFGLDLAKVHRKINRKKVVNRRQRGLAIHYVYVNGIN